MFMTGCVVLVMSSCHDKNTDRLWCIGLFQGVRGISNYIYSR